MNAIWYRARAEMRGGWRGWVVMALLVGLAGAAAMAAAAGARRTENVYERFLQAQNAADVVAEVRDAEGRPAGPEALRSLSTVADAADAVILIAQVVLPSGRAVMFPEVFPMAAIDGRFGSELNTRRVVEGRAPDQASETDVSVGVVLAEQLGIGVGDSLMVRLFPDPDSPEGMVETVVEVVAIGVMPGELQPLAGSSIPAILFTKAFHERYAEAIPLLHVGSAIRFHDGVAALPVFEEEARRRGFAAQVVFHQEVQTESVRRSTRFEAASLWVLAVLIGLATAVVLGQAIARQASMDAEEHPILRVLGMSQADLIGAALIRAGMIGGVAAVVAIAASSLASPLSPLGLARLAEPTPGMMLDPIVASLGAATIVLMVAVAVVAAQWRSARVSRGAPAALALGRRSRTTEALARAGAPPSVTAGVRLALERGHGRTSVPVRSAVGGTSLAVLAIVVALTFASSMDRLIETPSLSGWSFDAMVIAPPGGHQRLTAGMDQDEDVASWSEGGVPTVLVGGSELIEAALVLGPGTIEPAIADGRAPVSGDEIALGRDAMMALDVSIGDVVELAAWDLSVPQGMPKNTQQVRIVGRLVMPPLGFDMGGAGQGIAFTLAGWRILDPTPRPQDLGVFVRLRPQMSVQEWSDAIMGTMGQGVLVSSRRESGVVRDIARISRLPFILAAALLAMGGATLIHTLLASVRRRSRDFAVLRTLGFVSREMYATVVWQGTTLLLAALLVGIPLGIAVGRWGWIAFADALGVIPVAVVPTRPLILLVPALVLFVNLTASLLARTAARARPAAVLRTE